MLTQIGLFSCAIMLYDLHEALYTKGRSSLASEIMRTRLWGGNYNERLLN